MRILLSILILLATWDAFAQSPLPDAPHVYVEGSSRTDFKPDELTMTLRYSAVDSVAATAKAKVDSQTRVLLRSCADLGIASRDISASALSIGPEVHYEGDKRVQDGTRVTRQIEITLRDLSKYSGLMAGVMKSNVSEIATYSFGSSQKNKMIAKTQTLALADAKKRAEALVSAAGRRLGDVYSISEFNLRQEEAYQLIPSRGIMSKSASHMALFADAAPMGAGGGEIFQPGEITAYATVYVVYLLKSK